MSTPTASRVTLVMWVSVLWSDSDGQEYCQQSHGFPHTDPTRGIATTLRRISRWYDSPRVLSVLVHYCEYDQLPEAEVNRVFDEVRSQDMDSLLVTA